MMHKINRLMYNYARSNINEIIVKINKYVELYPNNFNCKFGTPILIRLII